MLLARSLIDRAGAFAAYVRAVEARTTRSDETFKTCLKLFHAYADIFQRQVTKDANRFRELKARHNVLSGLAMSFLEREAYFDQYFARGSHKDVPRALLTMVKREMEAHGLHDYEPVLTVGPPDNYEVGPPTLIDAQRFDLYKYLFGNHDALTDSQEERDLRNLSDYRKISVLSVPYMEGAQAIWHPIVLGHEVAHMRLHNDAMSLIEFRPQDWINEYLVELAVLLESDGDARGISHDGARITPREIQGILKNWVNEVACDLNAVRLFGPAGLTAIAQFLFAAGRKAEKSTDSHPPLSLRIDAMTRLLLAGGDNSLPPYADAWKTYLEGWRETLSPVYGFVSMVIQSKMDAISGRVLSWGGLYQARDREVEIAWMRDELLNGLPGAQYCPEWTKNDGPIVPSDIINAAWAARSVVEDAYEDRDESRGRDWDAVQRSDPRESPSPLTGSMLLNAPGLTLGQKRRRVDRLAAKALDSYDFTLMLEGAGHTTERYWSAEDAEPSRPQGAVISQTLIRERLALKGQHRIVISPLFEDDLQDTGVDVRLAPEFIAFRHSGTPVYDPLDNDFDPRSTQESVYKAWGEPFILHPGDLVLAATLEYVAVPFDLTAQVITRSSFGRLGLITATAVGVQPGSRGCITLELVNHGTTPIALYPGTRVAELVFFTIADPIEGAQPGKYWFSTGPEFSRVHEDGDVAALRTLNTQSSPILHRQREAGRVAKPTGEVSFRLVVADSTLASTAERLAVQLSMPIDLRAVEAGQGVESLRMDRTKVPDNYRTRFLEALSHVPEGVIYMLVGAALFKRLVRFVFQISRTFSLGLVVDTRGEVPEVYPEESLPKGTILLVTETGTELLDVGIVGEEQLSDAMAKGIGKRVGGSG